PQGRALHGATSPSCLAASSPSSDHQLTTKIDGPRHTGRQFHTTECAVCGRLGVPLVQQVVELPEELDVRRDGHGGRKVEEVVPVVLVRILGCQPVRPEMYPLELH